MRKLAILLTAAAVGIGATSYANAGGLVGDFINNFVPGAGTALDNANRRFRESQSDQSVYNQITGGWWNPPGEPARAPAPVMGNRCATPAGAYFGPPNPVGSGCIANTPYGPYSGTVIQ
jgi:hypothetical protein